MVSATSPQPYQQSLRRRNFIRAMTGYALVAPPLLLITLLIFYPALQSVIHTLVSTEGGTTHLSLTHYIDFFNSPLDFKNLIFTIEITLITIVLLFLLCFPLAIYLRFSHSRIAAWVQVLTLFPLFVPAIVLAFALIRFFGGHGTLETILRAIGLTGYRQPYLKPSGIIIGLVWGSIPFTVLILTAGLRQIDDALIDSARDIGASNWQIFRRILLPLLRRAVLIVFALNFIDIFGSYTIPYLLGPAEPQMMGVSMQVTIEGFQDNTRAETQAVMSFLICMVVGIIYIRTIARQRAEQR